MPQYSQIQLIAYQVPTLQVIDPGNISIPDVPSGTKSDPLLDAKNLFNLDARMRVLRLYQVADFARTKAATKLGGSDTLKIFIAPEFYFRDGTMVGTSRNLDGYSGLDVAQSIFAALMSAFKQDNFKDWLIIPGTIFFNMSNPAQIKEKLYFNTVCVIRGRSTDITLNENDRKSAIPVVGNGTTNQKSLMSHIDYYFDPDSGKKIDKSAFDGAINYYFSRIMGDWPWQKGHIFQVKDILGSNNKPITFGLEVCLEHALSYVDPVQKGNVTETKGILKRTLEDWSTQENQPIPIIDAHLLTSCGQGLRRQNVCARTGGYAMVCDGKSLWSEMKKMDATTTAGSPLWGTPIGSEPFPLEKSLKLNPTKDEEAVVVFEPAKL